MARIAKAVYLEKADDAPDEAALIEHENWIPARLMGYSHVGSYLYISEEKKLHNDPGFWLRFLDSIDGIISEIGKKGLDGVKDHGMDNYLGAVKRWDCEF